MKTLAWIVFFFEIVLFVWLYDKYPTPMLMGTFSMVIFLIYDLIFKKKLEDKNKHMAIISVVGLVLFGLMAFLEPSTIEFVGATGNGTFTPLNFWHGLVAAFVQYFMSIAGLWAWQTAEISEFLTKERL